MRKTILIMMYVLIGLSLVTYSQQRQPHKPKAKPPSIPADEILYTQMDYDVLSGLVGWRVVTRAAKVNGIQTVVSYDPERVFPLHGTNIKQAWIKFEDLRGGMMELREGYSLLFDEYDCSENRWRTLETSDYDKDGKVDSHPGSKQWFHVVPDSVVEAIFGVICLGEGDQQERDMKEAARRFRLGRQFEKRGNISLAKYHYEGALEHATEEPKILAALERLKK